MERLTAEQIRLLEELRELRDSGILTVDEFEVQVAKVLGRPLVVEPIPFVEEPLAPQETDETAVAENPDEAQQVKQSDVADVALVPDTSHESELLEYELNEPDISDEDEILVEENQVAEPPSTSYTSALPIVETETQQNVPSRRKVLIGTTAGLVLIAVIGFVALVGGGKSDSTSTQIVDSTTIVTQSTAAVTTQAPTTSTTTTTEAIPTTTYEVLECPYTRVIEAVDGKIVSPEGFTMEVVPGELYFEFGKYNAFAKTGWHLAYTTNSDASRIQIVNQTNFRTRTTLSGEIVIGENRYPFTIPWENLIINGFERTFTLPGSTVFDEEPSSTVNRYFTLLSAEIRFNCP